MITNIAEQILKYVEENDLPRAQELIVQNDKLMCDDVNFLKSTALFYIKIGQCYQAIAQLKKARLLMPEDMEIYYYLSYAYEFRENDVLDEKKISIKNSDFRQSSFLKGIMAARESKQNEFVGKAAPLVSIILSCKACLTTVRSCVECVLEHTDDIDYELILVNNGAADDVMNYFHDVVHPRKKIVQIKQFVGKLSWQLGLREACGKYFLFMNDHVVVTKRWLNNMIKCIESDITIGIVTPTSNINCADKTRFSYQDFFELDKQAEMMNISDWREWEERLVIRDEIMLCRKACIDTMGFCDYGFNVRFAEDLSFRYRRGGYKLILCGDVFVHYQEENQERTKENDRQDLRLFEGKFCGIKLEEDLFSAGEENYGSLLRPTECSNESIEILGVEVKCGSGLLTIQNHLRKAGIVDVNLSASVSRAKYYLDLKTICHGDVCVDRATSLIENFYHKTYDYIILGEWLNFYDKPFVVIRQALQLLRNGGKLIVGLKNLQDIKILLNCIWPTKDIHKAEGWAITKEALGELLTANHALIVQEIRCCDKLGEQEREKLTVFIQLLALKDQEKMMEKWMTHQYIFAIEKAVPEK